MASHEGGDVFTLIHHELNICTNSVNSSCGELFILCEQLSESVFNNMYTSDVIHFWLWTMLAVAEVLIPRGPRCSNLGQEVQIVGPAIFLIICLFCFYTQNSLIPVLSPFTNLWRQPLNVGLDDGFRPPDDCSGSTPLNVGVGVINVKCDSWFILLYTMVEIFYVAKLSWIFWVYGKLSCLPIH